MKTPKTLKNKPKRQQTLKKYSAISFPDKANCDNIVTFFIELLNTIKLYHWRTKSFAQHKATDELYSSLNANVDKFVEIMLGKYQSRLGNMNKRVHLYDAPSIEKLKEKMFECREFLIDFNMFFDYKKHSDLLNVRDEILGNINQFLYLLTFD